MATITYFVALAFKRSEDNGEVVACDPKEARSAEQAIRMTGSLAVARRNFIPTGRACSRRRAGA